MTFAQDAIAAGKAQRNTMLLAWGCAALAVLSKGIVVGVLTGGALMIYSLLERDWGVWRRLHALPGTALFLLIAAPWFVLVTLRNPSFPGFFFVHEHFARFLTTVHQRVEPWWFFLPLLLLAVLPWAAAAWRSLGAYSIEAPRTSRSAAATGFRPLRFLFIFCAVTLLFFSASGSKLAPYILPMVPLLAILAGVYATDPERLARRASQAGAALVFIVAAGLVIYCVRRNSFVPEAVLVWCATGALTALAALLLNASRSAQPAVRAQLVTALAGILAWQFLLCGFSLIPPARSAARLVSAVRPFIDPGMPLYSVGQYRETISPYLGRTLVLAGYEGELQFGLTEEPGRRMSVEQFARSWSSGGAAVAFFEPDVWDTWRRRGLPGRVIAADFHTVAVSRL